jgi:hypothetical protein
MLIMIVIHMLCVGLPIALMIRRGLTASGGKVRAGAYV